MLNDFSDNKKMRTTLVLLLLISVQVHGEVHWDNFLKCMELTETSTKPGYESLLRDDSKLVGTLNEKIGNSQFNYGFKTLIYREAINSDGSIATTPAEKRNALIQVTVFKEGQSISYQVPQTAQTGCSQRDPQFVFNLPADCSTTYPDGAVKPSCEGNGVPRLGISLSKKPPLGICGTKHTFLRPTDYLTPQGTLTTKQKYFEGNKRRPSGHNIKPKKLYRRSGQRELKNIARRALINRLTHLSKVMGADGLQYNETNIRMALFKHRDTGHMGHCHHAFSESSDFGFMTNQILCAMNPDDKTNCKPNKTPDGLVIKEDNPNRHFKPPRKSQSHPLPGLLDPIRSQPVSTEQNLGEPVPINF